MLPVLPALAQPAEERSRAFDILSRDSSEWYIPRSTVSFGLRVMSSGAAVNFGNLGTVPSLRTIAPASDGAAERIYDNGAIAKDALRSNEVDANGNQTSTPGGRYQTTVTDSAGNTTLTGDFLSYTPGQSRTWTYSNASQAAVPGQVAFNTYSAVSEGATASDDQGPTGGVDVQLTRALNRPGAKFQWGLMAGISLSDISAKANGTVTSTLRTRTDVYSLIGGGPAPGAPYSAPSFTDVITDTGNTIIGGFESTVPISEAPIGSSESLLAGAASVQGNWQIKGAYFLLRLGPSIRTQLTSRMGLSASAGIAGAYTGSRYIVVETLQIPDVAEPITVSDESTAERFLSGFYADLNLDWMLNERTGFFGGVSMQQLGDYDQSVRGRTAKIDMGNAVGFRGGINIRF
jgi:hypothetical protein